MRKNIVFLATMVMLSKITICLASPDTTSTQQENSNTHVQGIVEDRAKKEEKIPPNYFAIAFYKPTYVLPYYYTGSPYNAVYVNNTPNNQQLKHSEVKYQLSVKIPLWKDIFNYHSTLYLGYTQQSYWQVYNHDAFFRETDYEPELFLANEINFHLIKDWNINFLNIGADHQSNGYGGSLERSWNRMYVEAVSSTGNWMLSLRPWYIISTNENNDNMAKYMGYGQLFIGYKYRNNVFSLSTRNLINHAKRVTTELTWSFPITPYIKGYAQIFSGYGQSLIEYNHRTNSAGLGVALSDWV